MSYPDMNWDNDISSTDMDLDVWTAGLDDPDLALSLGVEALEEMCRNANEDLFITAESPRIFKLPQQVNGSSGVAGDLRTPFSQYLSGSQGGMEGCSGSTIFPPLTPNNTPSGPAVASIPRSQSASLPVRGTPHRSPDLGLRSPIPNQQPPVRLARLPSSNGGLPLAPEAWGPLQPPGLEAPDVPCTGPAMRPLTANVPLLWGTADGSNRMSAGAGSPLPMVLKESSPTPSQPESTLFQELQQMLGPLQVEKAEALKKAEDLGAQLSAAQKRIAELEKQLRACLEGIRREGLVGSGVKPPPGFNPNAHLVCNIRGEGRIIKAEKAAKLPWDLYTSLYTGHVETAREIIKHGLPASGSQAALRMEALGRQLATLLVTQSVVAPRNLCRLHCVKIQQQISTERPPPDAWRGVMADLHLTSTQTQAAATKYRAFQAAMKELLGERHTLLVELAQAGNEVLDASCPAVSQMHLRLGVLKDRLGMNLDAVLSHCAALSAWFLQECLMPVQLSMLFMFSFPYIPDYIAIVQAAVVSSGDVAANAPLFNPKPRSAQATRSVQTPLGLPSVSTF
eukprot:jgi/Botrbrau1/21292/Bobra.0184s0005.1